jgi:hypothetical protein
MLYDVIFRFCCFQQCSYAAVCIKVHPQPAAPHNPQNLSHLCYNAAPPQHLLVWLAFMNASASSPNELMTHLSRALYVCISNAGHPHITLSRGPHTHCNVIAPPPPPLPVLVQQLHCCAEGAAGSSGTLQCTAWYSICHQTEIHTRTSNSSSIITCTLKLA